VTYQMCLYYSLFQGKIEKADRRAMSGRLCTNQVGVGQLWPDERMLPLEGSLTPLQIVTQIGEQLLPYDWIVRRSLQAFELDNKERCKISLRPRGYRDRKSSGTRYWSYHRVRFARLRRKYSLTESAVSQLQSEQIAFLDCLIR